MFLINSYVYQSFSGLDLADYSSDSPVLALSTRRINSGYTGPLIRLRRSTDSTEQDFGSGLGMGETVDYSAIDTFLSGGTAHVVKWYDQSGQSRDLVQATASRQPLFNAGATTGRAVEFTGTSNCYMHSVADISGGFFSSGPAVSAHLATDNNDNGFCSQMAIGNGPNNQGQTTYFRTNRYGTNNRFAWEGAQLSTGGNPTTSGNEYGYFHHDGSTMRVDLNDTEKGTRADADPSAAAGDNFHLGGDANRHFYEGYIYELIIFFFS